MQADGTYEWKGRGPGGDTDRGVWVVRGEPQSPTLSLKCKTSDDPEREGKTVDVKIVRVTEGSLAFKSPESTPLEFTRAMKPAAKAVVMFFAVAGLCEVSKLNGPNSSGDKVRLQNDDLEGDRSHLGLRGDVPVLRTTPVVQENTKRSLPGWPGCRKEKRR